MDTPEVQHQTQRPESPVPSCMSLKSNWSMEPPEIFTKDPLDSDFLALSCLFLKSIWSMERPEIFKKDPLDSDFPVPSCFFMESDWSMESKISRNEHSPSDARVQHQTQRPESPVPSCMSLKSNWSMEPPEILKKDPLDSEIPVFRYLSSKSIWSMEPPETFKNDPLDSEIPVFRYLSSKSIWSMEPPETFKKDPLDSDFPVPSCFFMESDWSMESKISRNEHSPSDARKNSAFALPEVEPRCSVCEEVPRDPVSITCGHWFCRQCITSYWDQPGPSGDYSCPQCRTRSRTQPELLPPNQPRVTQSFDNGDVLLQQACRSHRMSLKKRLEYVVEGTDEVGTGTLLKKIYTDLHITEGETDGVSGEHEVWQFETESKMNTFHDTPINANDIFKPLPGQERNIRTVLTKGIAGIGKTFCVQKFTLDWAEGKANQNVNLICLLSFRELNLIEYVKYSLLGLIGAFHPSLKTITAEMLQTCKVLFIIDGLDESRLPLDFQHNEIVSDVTQTSSVDVLLTNLIKGNLLPPACLWITSQPAAANQIPSECVDMVTEVRGFADPQKEEYFKKKFSDNENLGCRIFSHIKMSRSLYDMCRVPLFCWMTGIVQMHVLSGDERGEMPATLTEMYAHFLLIQTQRKNQKYRVGHELTPQELLEIDREVLLKLGKLAFTHLEKGNLMFYQEDLEECGLDVKEASLCSGVFTEIFKKEYVLSRRTVFCFVHLSVQEFLAAVYMFHCYATKDEEGMRSFQFKEVEHNQTIDLQNFLEAAMSKSLRSKNGHLDLFVRFLHGLSLDSNQSLLRGLLTQAENSPESRETVIKNLKVMDRIAVSPDRYTNAFHCLMEMKDRSLHQEVQKYLKSERKLSPI